MSTTDTRPLNRRRIKLESGTAANAYHRAWFKELQAGVTEGMPFVLVSAETPLEILRAMEIPYVSIQWWSSIVSAKQKAPEYLDRLRSMGYPDDRAQYFSLGFASAFDRDPASAAWGGLPTPTLLLGDPRDDNLGKIFELWAREYGAVYYEFERSVFEAKPVEWWALGRRRWDELYDPLNVDLLVEESKGLIRFLETATGRTLSETKLKRVCDLVNEQEEYNAAARDLVAKTVPCPVSVSDSFVSIMMPQWHRGTEWARDAAQRFYLEIKDRVDRGEAACADERVRLAWMGTGLWFDVNFYDSFIDRYGAVFVWSMYLGIAADGYARYGDDPLRALAARYVAFTQQVAMEPWSSSWYVKEAQLHQIDGVIVLGGVNYFLERAFKEAGIPVLAIKGHNVDSRAWDENEVASRVGAFIEGEAGAVAARRRGLSHDE